MIDLLTSTPFLCLYCLIAAVALVLIAEWAEFRWIAEHPEEPEPLTSRPRLGVYYTPDEIRVMDELFPRGRR